MILAILFVTVLMVLFAYEAARRQAPSYCLAWIVVPGMCMGLLSPLLLGIVLPLVVVAGVCHQRRIRPRVFLATSLLVVLLAFGGYSFYSSSEFSEAGRARKQYPFESIAETLSYGDHRQQTRTDLLSNAQEKHVESQLLEYENPAREKHLSRFESTRSYTLRWLHQDTVTRFAETPGFGQGRMILRPHLDSLPLPEGEPIPQPTPVRDYVPDAAENPEAARKEVTAGSLKPPLWPFHMDAVLDFVNAEGFGYVESRERVAGFQSHRFRQMPQAQRGQNDTWHVWGLELVSLLRHERPVVYLSRHLPRMDQLRRAKTRPLTPFEEKALPLLRKGEGLAMQASRDRLRMLGALRASTQCLDCHEVQRGDLLGAFTYDLRREKP